MIRTNQSWNIKSNRVTTDPGLAAEEFECSILFSGRLQQLRQWEIALAFLVLGSPLLSPPPSLPPPATLSGLNCQKLKLKNPADTELRPGEIWKISFDAASR